jgi:hypothetical protein
MLFPHKKVTRPQIERKHSREHGFGLCAVELPQNGSFASRVEMMVGTNRHYTHEAGQHGASRKELQQSKMGTCVR